MPANAVGTDLFVTEEAHMQPSQPQLSIGNWQKTHSTELPFKNKCPAHTVSGPAQTPNERLHSRTCPPVSHKAAEHFQLHPHPPSSWKTEKKNPALNRLAHQGSKKEAKANQPADPGRIWTSASTSSTHLSPPRSCQGRQWSSLDTGEHLSP